MHCTDRQTYTQSVVCRSVVCRPQMHTLTANHRPNTLQTTDHSYRESELHRVTGSHRYRVTEF